jgi:hypothetical protein
VYVRAFFQKRDRGLPIQWWCTQIPLVSTLINIGKSERALPFSMAVWNHRLVQPSIAASRHSTKLLLTYKKAASFPTL